MNYSMVVEWVNIKNIHRLLETMRTKTVIAILSLLIVSSFSTSLSIVPGTSDTNLLLQEMSETSARNNSTSEYVDIDHSGYVWETANMVEVWASGTDVHAQFTSGNLVIGESYQLIWNLSDSTSNVGVYDQGNVNWNATSTTSVESTTVSGLADGTYYFHATLVQQGSHIATDMTTIQVGNNTGGNNSGGNNTGGNNSGGNNGGGNSMHNNSSAGGGQNGGVKPGGNTTGGNNGTVMNGTSMANPLMPIIDCSDIPWNDTNITGSTNITIDDCVNSTSEFWFWFEQTGKMTWLDPIVAVGYDFIVYSGPTMTSVQIPTGYGDDVFDLYLYGGNGWYDTNIDIDAGVTYTFPDPVERMSIRGIEAYEMLDPNDPTAFVTGITFASSDPVLMTMTPVTENYTMQGCGYDPSLTELMIWTDLQTYVQGATTYADYHVNCSVNTKDYELHVFAYSASGSSWSDYDEWNWTETDGFEAMDDDWTNLDAGTYCINASLYMVSGGAYQFVDFDFTCFTVTAANNGGGNSGTLDPCGLNSSYTTIWSWSDAQTYNYGDSQNLTFYVNCTRIGQSYMLEYHVYDITNSANPVAAGSYSWLATMTYQSWNDIVIGLDAGDYCVKTNLYQSGNYLTDDGGTTCFTVVGTSVNTPPTLTAPQQALVAYAGDPLDCYANGMVFIDPDNDPDNSNIEWFVNGNSVASGVQAILPAGSVSLGNSLYCEATAHDGITSGNTLQRYYYVVPSNNTAPTVSDITISPTSPEESDTLTCSYTYNDPDNDPDASMVVWSINGVATTTQGTSLDSGYVAGDFVTCSVTAFDGTSAGNTGTGTVLVMTTGGGSTPTIGVLGTLAVLSVAFVLVSRKEIEE